MQVGREARDGVGDDRRRIAVVEGLAGRLLDADLRDRARDDERAHAERAQARVEVGAVEGAVAELVDDRLAGLAAPARRSRRRTGAGPATSS